MVQWIRLYNIVSEKMVLIKLSDSFVILIKKYGPLVKKQTREDYFKTAFILK